MSESAGKGGSSGGVSRWKSAAKSLRRLFKLSDSEAGADEYLNAGDTFTEDTEYMMKLVIEGARKEVNLHRYEKEQEMTLQNAHFVAEKLSDWATCGKFLFSEPRVSEEYRKPLEEAYRLIEEDYAERDSILAGTARNEKEAVEFDLLLEFAKKYCPTEAQISELREQQWRDADADIEAGGTQGGSRMMHAKRL